MSLHSDMITALARVPAYLGEALSYRRMTGDPNVEPRTYTSYTSFTALIKGHTDNDDWDSLRGSYMSTETMSVVCDNTIVLTQGDQIRDGASRIWSVKSVDSSGPGIIHYTLESAASILASGGDRGGGV